MSLSYVLVSFWLVSEACKFMKSVLCITISFELFMLYQAVSQHKMNILSADEPALALGWVSSANNSVGERWKHIFGDQGQGQKLLRTKENCRNRHLPINQEHTNCDWHWLILSYVPYSSSSMSKLVIHVIFLCYCQVISMEPWRSCMYSYSLPPKSLALHWDHSGYGLSQWEMTLQCHLLLAEPIPRVIPVLLTQPLPASADTQVLSHMYMGPVLQGLTFLFIRENWGWYDRWVEIKLENDIIWNSIFTGLNK